MATETIILELDTEAARAFKSASSEEQGKLQVLLSIWLREYAKADRASLKRTMDDLSQKEQDRGLTPEILASILED